MSLENAAEEDPEFQRPLISGSSTQSNLHLELHHTSEYLRTYAVFLKAKISILGADLDKRYSTISFQGYSKDGMEWKNEEFIEKSILMEKADELLSKNSLVIYCEILQLGYVNIQKESIPIYDDSKLLDDYSKLFENSLFADATINVKGHSFRVHKAIITVRCSFFAAMFNPESRMKEQVEGIAEINDISVDVFREILRFIYTGKVENIKENVADLLIAAEKYDLNVLKAICEREMYEILSEENAMEFLIIVDRLNISLLKKRILRFIKQNITVIIAQDNWTDILSKHVDLLTEILQMQIEN
ncbi:speckle-type POZ protein-like isoform X2 [Leptopilina heterotoma]|uniref:speckle-type POZ protein-like isoform X2 n=1 Tax=Leptopilina heterotoma TaxID=63436 RepID=UPI001CA84784|nr:speckle-type POZ protein-like isoform X2 [Leptopilina heterotoma]